MICSAMDFVSDTGRRLETLADWRDHAGGVAPKQWAEGRSARELARAWLEGDAVERVTALLGRLPELSGLVLDHATAEKITYFDDIPAGPRHHDLLVFGRSPSGPLIIGVEGTADESFGERLDAWMATAQARSDATRAPERLDQLTRGFFGTTLADDPLLLTLRYQLLAALAGTIADAREQQARHAVVLVHEFETEWTDDTKHERNREDLEAFVARLLPGAERAGEDDAWIAGPREIAGVDVYVAKLVTSTR